jgi:predicted heme/steroid binding protein
MTKQKIVGLVLGIIVIIGGFTFSQRALQEYQPAYKPEPTAPPSTTTTPSQPVTPPTTSPTPTPKPTTPPPAPSGYTMADVAKHGDAASCWTAINGSVYDLTAWIARHPGGEGAILSICGADGSAAFNDQHGGQGRPERILESYKIGPLN